MSFRLKKALKATVFVTTLFLLGVMAGDILGMGVAKYLLYTPIVSVSSFLIDYLTWKPISNEKGEN